jgi:hypothetical protein
MWHIDLQFFVEPLAAVLFRMSFGGAKFFFFWRRQAKARACNKPLHCALHCGAFWRVSPYEREAGNSSHCPTLLNNLLHLGGFTVYNRRLCTVTEDPPARTCQSHQHRGQVHRSRDERQP